MAPIDDMSVSDAKGMMQTASALVDAVKVSSRKAACATSRRSVTTDFNVRCSSGNKRIDSLEKEFDTVFGLYCQVCYTDADGKRYYTSGSDDNMTLSAFNKKCEAEGCKKGEWK